MPTDDDVKRVRELWKSVELARSAWGLSAPSPAYEQIKLRKAFDEAINHFLALPIPSLLDALDAARERVRELEGGSKFSAQVAAIRLHERAQALERERDDLLARAEAGCAYASECSFCAELQHEARTGGEE